MDNYFFEAFEGMKRLGPGSTESTVKAAEIADEKTGILNILDAGCGNGIHTLLLAELFPKAEITAIDNHEPFIQNLNKSAEKEGFASRITGKTASMLEMPFKENSFDLIWAESSIYIYGFEKALNDWKKFLKEDGTLVCSEVCWLTENPSDDIYDFWMREYQGIDTVNAKLKQIEEAGYKKVSYFIQPQTDWTDNYYQPLQENINAMRNKYKNNNEANEVLDMFQHEINMYRKYSGEFSYVFFVCSL